MVLFASKQRGRCQTEASCYNVRFSPPPLVRNSKFVLSHFTQNTRAHGFSANKLMGLASYAEAFASSGYASLVFDYRRWGASGQLSWMPKQPLLSPIS
jgi:hypothetical protein